MAALGCAVVREFITSVAAYAQKRLLPNRDRKRRMVFAPAYAAPQTRRRQATVVARDPKFIQRPHSAGAQPPLSSEAVGRLS